MPVAPLRVRDRLHAGTPTRHETGMTGMTAMHIVATPIGTEITAIGIETPETETETETGDGKREVVVQRAPEALRRTPRPGIRTEIEETGARLTWEQIGTEMHTGGRTAGAIDGWL